MTKRKLDKQIVGERPSRRKRRLRAAAARNARIRLEKAEWVGFHQNNNSHTRPEPSLAPITMRVVDWDVRPRR